MSVANSYAKALYQSISESKSGGDTSQVADQIQAQMDQILGVMGASKEAEVALSGPITTQKEKIALVTAFSKAISATPALSQFLVLLANKGRLGLLDRIRDEFTTVRLAAQGGIRGSLVSAEAMTPQDVDDLAKAFGRKVGKPVAFRVSVDPALLAGVKVTVGGVTYDGTLRSQLEQIRDRLTVRASA